MIEIFNENEVTAKNIANYMVNVRFLDDADTSGDCIEVPMECGLPYLISICKSEKNIKIVTCFHQGKKKTVRLRKAIKEFRRSSPMFFSTSKNGDEETHVQCTVSYEYGLLPKQLVAMANRFEGLIDHLDVQVLKNVKS